MNTDIARERLPYVIRPDSITYSEGDFLATHVAIKRLKLLDKFDIAPNGGKSYSEEEIYKQFVLNPDDIHQFIAVYGQSGTGKSHLIRWFAAKYEKNKSKDEVVLFIRRSDNTLKGTIRQLLNKPEVQDIENKDVYERLVRASQSIEEKKLKDMIYHNLIIEIDNEFENQDITITNHTRQRLVALLNNEVFHNHLMGFDGPIERIYSKIAENSKVDRDTVAEFRVEDMLISSDLYDAIDLGEADPKALRMARVLNSDSGSEDAKQLVDFINQFINTVIQRCAGIEPGDFKQVFLDIRRALFKLDKKLTLFIEDVTSFTGVDNALLDALIEEHTGKREGEELCRISAIVGTTNNYLQHNFKDNHKDRITKYIYIPSDVLDQDGLYEFFGKYINAMSLSEDSISDWVIGGANSEDYPIHDISEGKNWDHAKIGNRKKVSLYPFTKRSIIYFYNNILEKGHQTPRYIIRDIIEPICRDAIFNKNEFPSMDLKIVNVNTTLSFRLNSSIKDKALADRLFKFMCIWGNGSPDQYETDGITYIAAIPKSNYDDFGFVVPDMDKISAPSKSIEDDPVIPTITPTQVQSNGISEVKIKNIADANEFLSKWVNDKKVDISPTGGTAGRIRPIIVDEMPKFIFSIINWQSEGVSMDNVSKVEKSTYPAFALEGQTKKGDALYVLPATWESINIILAFLRWKEYGNKTWDYPESDFDAYLITTWAESIKKAFIKAVVEYKTGIESTYIEAAVAIEIYRILLSGEFREKSLKNFNAQSLLASKPNKSKDNSHSKEWNSLLSVIGQKGAGENNQETVRKYFNIIQGDGNSHIVLDPILFGKVFRRVKTNRLNIEDSAKQRDDRITSRKDTFLLLDTIEERLKSVVIAELQKGKALLQVIIDAFGDSDIEEEDIEAFFAEKKNFYEEANRSQVNVKDISVEGLKKPSFIAKAIEDIANVSEEDDSLTIIMAFSGDPISIIKPFVEYIEELKKEIEKAKLSIAAKNEQLTDGYDFNTENRYADELNGIANSMHIIEEMINS